MGTLKQLDRCLLACMNLIQRSIQVEEYYRQRGMRWKSNEANMDKGAWFGSLRTLTVGFKCETMEPESLTDGMYLGTKTSGGSH